MVLLIFGIYAIVTAKFQISRHYGLKGPGARVAGVVFVAFALGFFSILGVPITAMSMALDLGDEGRVVLGFILQIVALVSILFILLRIYGNGFAKSEPHRRTDSSIFDQ